MTNSRSFVGPPAIPSPKPFLYDTVSPPTWHPPAHVSSVCALLSAAPWRVGPRLFGHTRQFLLLVQSPPRQPRRAVSPRASGRGRPTSKIRPWRRSPTSSPPPRPPACPPAKPTPYAPPRSALKAAGGPSRGCPSGSRRRSRRRERIATSPRSRPTSEV